MRGQNQRFSVRCPAIGLRCQGYHFGMSLGPRTQKLISIAAGPLAFSGKPHTAASAELGEMLGKLNGFIAFESSLVVRGVGDEAGDLDGWNAPKGWRSSFEDLADGLYFFAEDIFGVQFAIERQAVVIFDPETGHRRPFASSIEDWADQLLDDYKFLTGYPLAHEWQQQHGQIPWGTRLIPLQPFVAGGDFDLSNLRATNDVEGMRERATFALKIRNIPDGGIIIWQHPGPPS